MTFDVAIPRLGSINLICKKPGYMVGNCPHNSQTQGMFEKKGNMDDVMSVKEENARGPSIRDIGISCEDMNYFESLRSDGWVSANEYSIGVSVKMLRDTASRKSIIFRALIPFLEDTLTEEHVVLRGVGETPAVAPLARLYLNSVFAKQFVAVIVPDPIVTFTPLIDGPISELEKVSPNLFLTCAVNCSQVTRVDSTVNAKRKSCEKKFKIRKSKKHIKVNKDRNFDSSLDLNVMFTESSVVNTKGGPGVTKIVPSGNSSACDAVNKDRKLDTSRYGVDYSKLPITTEVLVKA